MQLDESRKNSVIKVFNVLKDADCEAYMEPRADGGSLLDYIILDIASGAAEEQAWEKGIECLEEMMTDTSHTYQEQHNSAYLTANGMLTETLFLTN